MKLTRYCHACILVEQDGLNVLFDPGVYSAAAAGIKLHIPIDGQTLTI